MRWEKWSILDLFSVLGWPNRAKKGDHVLTVSPMFSVFFVYLLTTFRPCFQPVLFSIFIEFLIFLLQIWHNTARNIHNTQPQSHPQTHAHTQTPTTNTHTYTYTSTSTSTSTCTSCCSLKTQVEKGYVTSNWTRAGRSMLENGGTVLLTPESIERRSVSQA